MTSFYADTSFLVAARFRADTFHLEAIHFYAGREQNLWLWSPWHRVEVFNTLRQLTRNPDRRRLKVAEAKAIIHQLEMDVRHNFLTHMEVDWRDVLRTSNAISMASAFARNCRATDVLHVAYAIELAAEVFVSFDDDQLELAEFAGLKGVRPPDHKKN